MATGKVIILKDMGCGELDVSSEIMNQMAKDLGATIIHLPLKYDLEYLGLGALKTLHQDIGKEIKRRELLDKLERSK